MNVRPASVLALFVVGCSGPVSLEESVAEKTLALNACEETVRTEYSVDGFPAYAQCESVSRESIWSNNGIDTSTTSLGDDWVQTQWSGGYQCTEWAYRFMYFRFGVDYRHGDAREWCDGDLPSTLVKASTPMHGDLIVFDAGACGADETTGHIAVIDVVDMAEGTVTIVEQNRVGRRPADQTCGSCFLHAVQNDGGNAGAGGMAGTGGADTGGADTGGADTGGAEMGSMAGGSMAAFGGAVPAGGRSSTAGDAGSAAGGLGGEVGAHAGASGDVTQGASPGAGGMSLGASPSGGSAVVGGAPEPVPTHNAGMPTFTAGGSGAGTSAAGQGQVALPAVGGAELSVGTGCSVATHVGRERTSSALALLALFAAARSARRRRSLGRQLS